MGHQFFSSECDYLNVWEAYVSDEVCEILKESTEHCPFTVRISTGIQDDHVVCMSTGGGISIDIFAEPRQIAASPFITLRMPIETVRQMARWINSLPEDAEDDLF